jgi:hypothetical protein
MRDETSRFENPSIDRERFSTASQHAILYNALHNSSAAASEYSLLMRVYSLSSKIHPLFFSRRIPFALYASLSLSLSHSFLYIKQRSPLL